jgi:hypothetical protein
MKKLLVLLLFVPLTAFAQIAKECPQFTVNGTPVYPAKLGDQEICHTNYAVIHKCDVKGPIAVFEHLTKDKITGGLNGLGIKLTNYVSKYFKIETIDSVNSNTFIRL